MAKRSGGGGGRPAALWPRDLLLLPLLLLALVGAEAEAEEAWPESYDGPARRHRVSVAALGARGDGVSDDTRAFVAALARCDELELRDQGGCLVLVPGGGSRVYAVAPFNLTSHATLYVAEGATLKALDDPELWPIIPPLPSFGQGRDHPGPRRSSLVHGVGLVDVVLTGANGTVDGSGARWWASHNAGTETVTRGSVVELLDSADVVITNLTLRDSPFWTIHLFRCQRVRAARLTVLNPHDSPNTDGFDPDSSRDIVLEDSFFSTGDDGVAIKSGWDCFGEAYGVPSRDIVIRNLTVSSPCCAGVCIGSEMSGGVENVTVLDSTFADVHVGLRIKSTYTRGGYVRDVRFANIAVERAGFALQFNDACAKPIPSCAMNPSCPSGHESLPDVRNVTVDGLRGADCKGAADLEGLAGAPLREIVLRDIRLERTGPWTCNSHVRGRVEGGVSPPPPRSCGLEQ